MTWCKKDITKLKNKQWFKILNLLFWTVIILLLLLCIILIVGQFYDLGHSSKPYSATVIFYQKILWLFVALFAVQFLPSLRIRIICWFVVFLLLTFFTNEVPELYQSSVAIYCEDVNCDAEQCFKDRCFRPRGFYPK